MITNRFRYAAQTYEAASNVQKKVAHQLWGCRPMTRLSGPLMDFGCGTGYLAHQLAVDNPDCKILGVDKEPAMIDQAAAKYKRENLQFRTASLSDPIESVDWVVSNMCLQWLLDPTDHELGPIQQLTNVARKGVGLSIVVQPTGSELIQCLKVCCPQYLPVPAQAFWEHSSLVERIQDIWPHATIHATDYRESFSSTKALLRSMQATGIHASKVHGHLWTAQHLRRMDEIFRRQFYGVWMRYRVIFCWIETR